MRKRMMSVLAVLALMVALAPSSPAAGRHPQIQEALQALRNARTHLMEAAHDFHGHKADAIKATDEAIRQLEICMQYD
jgi:type II secretory pathway component PulM